MKLAVAAFLYLSIGYMASGEIAKVYPSLARPAWKAAVLCVYWPVPLIRMNVEHLRRQQSPRAIPWKGTI
ncbi:hypothetical protein [Rhizobium wenxiniae]|uniref:hypothetical protein n=1 Tax=Rhizobium wenxiniae TaxID=1737357 RepID=UPI003C1D61FD